MGTRTNQSQTATVIERERACDSGRDGIDPYELENHYFTLPLCQRLMVLSKLCATTSKASRTVQVKLKSGQIVSLGKFRMPWMPRAEEYWSSDDFDKRLLPHNACVANICLVHAPFATFERKTFDSIIPDMVMTVLNDFLIEFESGKVSHGEFQKKIEAYADLKPEGVVLVVTDGDEERIQNLLHDIHILPAACVGSLKDVVTRPWERVWRQPGRENLLRIRKPE